MSLAGFKKQINKANQYVSEKIGGAKGTELDDEFVELERKTDSMVRLVDELMIKTHEMLQPNPASRARMLAVKSISKLRGQSNHMLYPQPEGQLGECMVKYGKELGDDSLFGQALIESGETYRQLAEIKYLMEDAVKQNYTEPLLLLQNKDLKEVNHHRKKMQGRRLDFDCKKRRQDRNFLDPGPLADEEMKQAEEKFEESKQLTEIAMHNLFDNDVEQVMQLQSFIEAELNYHRQSADTLEALQESLKQKCTEAANRPRKEYIPKRTIREENDNEVSGPSCSALYDFEAENEGELGFKEGDTIKLLSRIDENWLEGTINGQVGYFPTNYVKIVVDLP